MTSGYLILDCNYLPDARSGAWALRELDQVVTLLSIGPFTSIKYSFLCSLPSEHASRDPHGCSLSPYVTSNSFWEADCIHQCVGTICDYQSRTIQLTLTMYLPMMDVNNVSTGDGRLPRLRRLQDHFHRASFTILDALHGDSSSALPPPLRRSTWVRDRCRRVLCRASFRENEDISVLSQLPLRSVPRSWPVWNGPDLLQVKKTLLRTRYDHFCIFQVDKVENWCKSARADGFDKFMRSPSHGRRGGNTPPR